MALAAAYASGEQPPAVAFAPQPARSLAHGRKPPRGHAMDQGDDGAMEELPNIDDLEVAAAAAGVAPVPPVLAELGYFELGPPAAAAPEPMERSVTGSGEDSSSEESGGWCSERMPQPGSHLPLVHGFQRPQGAVEDPHAVASRDVAVVMQMRRRTSFVKPR